MWADASLTPFIDFLSYPTNTDIGNSTERLFIFSASTEQRHKTYPEKCVCYFFARFHACSYQEKKRIQKVKVENIHSATTLPINEALSLNEVELKMSLQCSLWKYKKKPSNE